MSNPEALSIAHLPTLPSPRPLHQLDYEPFRGQKSPIVIDNGSSTLRYGFAYDPARRGVGPRIYPDTSPNVISRFKDRKSNKPVLIFGDGVEFDSGARAQARTPWEGDVLLNFDALENALDYAFLRMGIDDADAVEHPVFMTERLCSPLHSRTLTSELMFELYGVPRLLYGIDSLMSFYQNNGPSTKSFCKADGLIVSFNTASTSVVPMLSGKGILSHCKRIPWGASHAADYLQRLVQLKYPTFPGRVTSPQITVDISKSLYAQHERVIQFPFAAPTENEKTEEELARGAERRRLQGKKLQEIAAQKRAEKLADMEEWLQHLTELLDRRETISGEEWKRALSAESYQNDAELENDVKKAEKEVNKRRKKDAADGDDQEEEEPSFPLLDTPDEELDEESLKEKRKQRMMKAGWEARVRVRREKEREREEKEAEERREADERERDLGGWADKLRREHEATMIRIKERTRRKAALSDRKSAVAQARMKSIASLAADDRVSKKRRKTGGEDMFGADDADWAIYRKINTAAASSDEEDDVARLETVESKLLAHDPTFSAEHTYAALAQKRSALMQAFRPQYDEGDPAGAARVHLSTERWRACETWFSPGIAGVDAAGLGEVIQNVLARFNEQEKGRLVKNVFLAGAPSEMPELMERVHNVMRPILPPEMELRVCRAEDGSLDPWRGMAHNALNSDLWKYAVTNEEYNEWGGERIRRWWGGNWNSSFVDDTV
ncbi:chromatin remodeling complex subunit [Phellopilus nigrolimitatus]|nr:chromatin remodeling complex subunit [Phellopilus nigrolimitatus]